MFYLGILFAIGTLECVKHKLLANAVSFGIGSLHFKGPRPTFLNASVRVGVYHIKYALIGKLFQKFGSLTFEKLH